MTDDEQSLMALGVQLHDGLRDMIDGGRLSLDDYPDDGQFLRHLMAAMAELCQRVRA